MKRYERRPFLFLLSSGYDAEMAYHTHHTQSDSRGRAICLFFVLLTAAALPAGAAEKQDGPRSERPPSVVLILCDNLGYGDIGCYGSRLHRTPHIDRLAQEGMRLTHAYASSGVCTPSRASLMTGCYPRRVNMHISDTGASVLQPVAAKGLHPDEITIAEVLKDQGYATALFGKWHLGDQPDFLPTRQGFDRYLGIPYSDDMTPRAGKPWPPLPLMDGERVIEAPVDRNLLTRRYTKATCEFIQAHRDEPFFICLAHAMPGSTQASFASDDFRGQSANGLWGDAVEEIDWSTGEIVRTLADLGLAEQTLVLFASDNGAPRRDPPQGSNAPLRGWGYDTSEGAMRVPLIARWPTHIPAGGTCREVCTLMDLYPTLAALAQAAPPKDRAIDGKDIRPLLFGRPEAKSPHEAVYFYFMDQLQAVRSGRWKLYLPLDAPRGTKNDQAPRETRLYDLESDIREQDNQAHLHPEVVRRLTELAEVARDELGDGQRPGRGQRPAGHVPRPTPRLLADATASKQSYHNIACEGTYPHHLQGVCSDGAAIYWSFTTWLVATDLDGKLLKKVPVASHHGDLTHQNAKLYVAVNLGKFNDPDGNADSWVYVYDAHTLQELARHEIQEVTYGAGGIGFHAGHFFVVGGLPDGVEVNYVYEYDDDFKLVKTHTIKSGHTHLGIQTAAFADDRWWLGCYGEPKTLLVTDAGFQMQGRYEFDASLGIEGLPGGRLLTANGHSVKGKGCTGGVRVAVPDVKTGLMYLQIEGNDQHDQR